MEQKCGTNHPTLQLGFKQVFKSFLKPLCKGCYSSILLFMAGSAVSPALAYVKQGIQTTQGPLAQHIIPANTLDLRERFAEAESKAARANELELAQLYKEFSAYPLWPYIEGPYLANNISLDKEPLILSFMQRYYGSAAERSVREAWLNYLARRNDAARFTRDFVNRGSTTQLCRYLGYRLSLEKDEGVRAEEIWPLVKLRWVQASSQPRICDPVFKQWEDAGLRTQEVIWERFDAAVNASNWSMARYIRSLLADSAQAEATAIMALRQRPTRIMNIADLPEPSERVRDHVFLALQQMAWRDLTATQKNWPALQRRYNFTQGQLNATNSLIGVVMAVRNESGAQQWFNNLQLEHLTESAQHWYLATLLREYDFAAVLEMTETFEPTSQLRYWKARSLYELERPVEAEAVLNELAQERHYYGFMASAHLEQTPNLSRERVGVNPTEIEALLTRPEVQRAYEFLQLERFYDARREWNLVRVRLNDGERTAAAILTSQWSWLDQSIREFANLGLLQDLERRFPLGYRDLLVNQAEHNSIDPAWAFAIIRRESAFQPDALSPVGARGLMQIMPDTAEYLVLNQPSGPNQRRSPNLNSPEDNISLGTRYLADLMRRNNDNWLLATASYNAGYYRVREWVPEHNQPVDIWIETIPYQETRDYVKAVLTYQQIYANLLGQDDKLMQHMHSMRIHTDGALCDDAEKGTGTILLC